jgi:serine/threonine-protein kinase
MTASERWRRVQGLCEALEGTVDPREWDARLRELEPADASIRAEVIALLEAVREEEAVRLATGEVVADPAPLGPEGLPGLDLHEVLGAGGSSTVYRAVRTVGQASQSVAVKVFHAGRGSHPEQKRRFVREQRILAALTHPAIVRLLDAGVSEGGSGQPYLVMELAEGEPITQYCDRMRLGLRERIQLLLTVCDAVAAAHRRLVVHLDLKPSNILVTPAGEVKLLDFGTAQLMDEAAELAVTSQMTPLYASPERLRGEAASVACDVYALGLILYECLSGGWPFTGRRSILGVAERAAGTTEIRPLAEQATAEAAELRGGLTAERARSELAGDLAAICAKALAFDAAERYGSVADLADDLRRYLDGHPVSAYPSQGWPYRAGKFLRRHRWSAAVAGVFALVIAAAAAYSFAQTRRAAEEAERTLITRNFLIGILSMATSDASAEKGMSLRKFLEIAERRVHSELKREPLIAVDLDIALANAYIGDGDAVGANRLLAEATRKVRGIPGGYARQAYILTRRGFFEYLAGKRSEAEATTREAIRMWEARQTEFTPEWASEVLLQAWRNLNYLNPGTREGLPYLHRALELSPGDGRPTFGFWRTQGEISLASAYLTSEFRPQEAYRLVKQAVSKLRDDPAENSELAIALLYQTMAARYLGKFEEEESAAREMVAISSRLTGPDSQSTVTNAAHWAMSLADLGRFEEAYTEAIRLLAAKRKFHPKRGSTLLWTNLHPAAYAACRLRKFGECEALASEALKTLGPSPDPNDYRYHDGRAILGLALAGQGRGAEARPLIEEAVRFNAGRNRVLPYAQLLTETLARVR